MRRGQTYQAVDTVLLLLANFLDKSIQIILLGNIADDWNDLSLSLRWLMCLSGLLQDLLTAGCDVDLSTVGCECLGSPDIMLEWMD